MGSRILVLALTSAVAAAVVAGCATVHTTQAGAVGVDRSQAMLVSSAEVDKAASQEYAKTIAAARQKGLLDQDPAQVQRVRTIANRLIVQTGAFRNDAPGWKWEVHVITSNQVNAWCMPGGKMAVYTALIEKLKLTDDELAAIMGHEIAHALREHGREQVSQQMATQLAVGIASAALGLGSGGTQLAGMVANVTFTLPNSRLHEQEADRIGVELAARAGYDPRAAVSVWEKMAKAESGGAPPQFLSTHPSAENRIKDLQVYADKVMPFYEAAVRKRG
ncbi:MAG TPA: M48 family metallopeptidase [Burkholderiales bacterium]|nr:M48 family metallopeptidase [Burkholderiales bacterium]